MTTDTGLHLTLIGALLTVFVLLCMAACGDGADAVGAPTPTPFDFSAGICRVPGAFDAEGTWFPTGAPECDE